MTTPRKPGFALPVAATVAVLLGLYVGPYYATVQPLYDPERYPAGVRPEYPTLARIWTKRNDGSTVRTKSYPLWQRFFAPIHWVDRKLRPRFWERPPPKLITNPRSLDGIGPHVWEPSE